jgi:hypothetical protein
MLGYCKKDEVAMTAWWYAVIANLQALRTKGLTGLELE